MYLLGWWGRMLNVPRESQPLPVLLHAHAHDFATPRVEARQTRRASVAFVIVRHRGRTPLQCVGQVFVREG